MAVVASAAENATDLMGKLNLDTKSKNHDAPEVTKKCGSADAKEAPKVPSAPCERSLTPLLQEYMDSSMCYVPNGYPSTAYYYGGYDGSVGEWDDYHRYMNHDGVEMPPHGVYGDMYHAYGYAPYGAYPSPGSPVPTMGHDGQLYGPQHYQYPATYYQPQAPQSTHYTPSQPPTQGEVSTSTAAEQSPIPVDAAKAKSNGFANGNANSNNGSAPPKTIRPNPSLTSNGSTGRGAVSSVHPSSGYQDPRFGFGGIRSPVPWFEPSVIPDGQQRQSANGTILSAPSHISNSPAMRNQNLRPLPHLMGLNSSRPTSGMGPTAPGLVNRMYPNNRMYAQSGNALRTGLGFGSNLYDSRMTPRWGVAFDSKYKPRGRGNGFYGYGNENFDGLSELNRGPRGGRFRNQDVFGSTVTIAVKGQNLSADGNVEDLDVVPGKEQLNRADFPEKYSDAKFFVIKSYSEDDVHKSIKYNVWASTPNGNKKLDDAYRGAQEKNGCPIFLFFSVNTSGQFVGVAEMTGPVDFNKTVDYWQQDKWTGCFSVKWHIVKDVPNNTLKHITLENNDNKPVTNSRDTQEVKLDQGLQMLKLFKEHVSKTSILDDFHFYETRQKAMLEKRARQQLIQKQVADGRPSNMIDDKDKDGATGKPRLQKTLEFVTVLKKDVATGCLAERKPSNDNVVCTVAGDTPLVTKPVAENRVLVNGVSNGC